MSLTADKVHRGANFTEKPGCLSRDSIKDLDIIVSSNVNYADREDGKKPKIVHPLVSCLPLISRLRVTT